MMYRFCIFDFYSKDKRDITKLQNIPVLKEVSPRRFYVNTGDWLVNRSFGVLEPGEPPRLLTWDIERGHPGPLF